MEKQSGNVYFLLDTSGSMDGSRINYVNSTFKDLIPQIKELSSDIKIAVITFSSGARLMTGTKPVPISEFKWQNPDTSGVTDTGEAFIILNDLMAGSDTANNLLFLISDGEPTDNWEPKLAKLKQNNNFNNANKIAIAIGDSIDETEKFLVDFAGINKAVFNNFNNKILLGFIEKSLKKLTKPAWLEIVDEMNKKISEKNFDGYIEKDEPVRYPASSSPDDSW